MVERYRRRKGKRKLLGNHQKCWIWGRHVVRETLRAGRWPILELRLGDRLPPQELHEVRALAEKAGVPVVVESTEALKRRCRSGEHQGYAAKMPEYPYAELSDVLARRPSSPLYAMLDSLQDPYNFGAILRSAGNLGVEAVFIARQGQVPVTSLVTRTSAGAVNHIDLVCVDDLADLAVRLDELGIPTVAATQDAAVPAFEYDFTGPTVVAIGNEGSGIRDSLLKVCRARVAIPQCGGVDSLNAAVSAGILFYEAARQRSLQTPTVGPPR